MNDRPHLTVIALRWKPAAHFINSLHRHLRAPRGGRFAIGAIDETGKLRGVAICGRPVSRVMDDGLTLEVTRTATDGCRNANSFLYGACYRIAAAHGYARIITYNQDGETGASLRASNFRLIRNLPARGSWAQHSKALHHIRDPIGAGGVQRNLWEREIA